MVDAERRVLELYGVPWSERADFEIDHLVPRASAAPNGWQLWPQPLEEAVRKDREEREICRAVCDLGTMSITDGQRFFIERKVAVSRQIAAALIAGGIMLAATQPVHAQAKPPCRSSRSG